MITLSAAFLQHKSSVYEKELGIKKITRYFFIVHFKKSQNGENKMEIHTQVSQI